MKQELSLDVKINTDGLIEKAQAIADARRALDEAVDNMENFIITHTAVTKANKAAGGNIDIYRDGYFGPQAQAMFEALENALGFKLFIWQKYFIITGTFRQYGATTAEILRDLTSTEEPPIDYTNPPRSNREKIYREELRKIQCRLAAANIPTRQVWWNKRDKREYYTKTIKKENTP